MLRKLYEEGHDFNTFMNADGGQHVDKVLNFLQLSSDAITDELREKILSIQSAKFVVFGEVWCPDCMINIAVLEAIHRLNSSVSYTVVPREGYEASLKSLTPDGTAKIPTFISVDDEWNAKGLFLEKPRIVREVEAGEDQVKRIVVKRDYRNGKYILDAMEEIIELL